MHKMELSLFLMYTPILKEHNSITQFYQRLKITSIIVHKYKRGLTRLYFRKYSWYDMKLKGACRYWRSGKGESNN